MVLSGPLVVVDSTTLIAEGFFPTNNAIDPGETVTVLFALKNVGGANTTNLVVTLLPPTGLPGRAGHKPTGCWWRAVRRRASRSPLRPPALAAARSPRPCNCRMAPPIIGTVTVSLTLGQPGIVSTQNFDTVTAPALPTGWTTTNTGVESAWVTRTTTNNTPPNAAYVPDPANLGTSALVSPSVRAAARPVAAHFPEQLQSGSRQQRLLRRRRARNQDRDQCLHGHPGRRRQLRQQRL